MGILIKFGLYVVSGPACAVLAPVLTFRIGVPSLDHETGDDSVENGLIVESFIRQLDKIVDVFWGIFGKKTYGDIPEFCVNNSFYLCHGHALLSRDGFVSINFRDHHKNTDQDYQDNETERDHIFFQEGLLLQRL
jgi:hypothetical protein